MEDLSIQISGMKSRLDGVESSIERLQEYRDELEIQIAMLQGQRKMNGNAENTAAALIHSLHPVPAEPKGKERRSGWPDDPAARKREGVRRQQVKAAKKKAAAQRAGAKKRWAKMTVKQRKEHLLKMQKGRKTAVKKAA